jgi:hypothetical protein
MIDAPNRDNAQFMLTEGPVELDIIQIAQHREQDAG